MNIAQLLIEFGIDARPAHAGAAQVNDAQRSIERQAADSTGRMSGHFDDSTKHVGIFGKAIGGLGSVFSVAGGLLLAGGVQQLIGFGQQAVDLAKAEDAINAQTVAAIRSTGGVANVTAAQVDSMAMSIMRETGVSDESIKTGENLLLTFTGIRNEVGAGNDIFNQATAAVTDMSVALGEDSKSAAIQLGKALNDPIKGVTALQRVGVSFTASQRDQIKAMVDAGDTMGAQKLILHELNTEFGGSAKAFGESSAGAWAKVGNAVEEAEKGFARLVLPMAEAGLQLLPPLIDDVASLTGWVGNLVNGFMGLAPVKDTISLIGGALSDLGGIASDVFSSGLGAGDWGVVFDDIRELIAGLGPQAGQILGELGTLWSGIANQVADAAPGLLQAGLNLWMQFEIAVWDAAPGVIDAVASLAQGAFDWIINTGVPAAANAIGPLFDQFTAWLPVITPKVVRALGELLGKTGEFVVHNAPILAGKLLSWGEAFVGWVGQRAPSLLASLGDLLGKVGAWIVNVGLPALADDLVKGGQALVAWIGPQIKPALGALGDFMGKLGAWIVNPGIPTLVGKMGDMGRAGAAALMDFLVGRNGQTGLTQMVAGWFTGTFIPSLPGLAIQVGQGFVSMWATIGKMMANAVAGAIEASVNVLIRGINSLQIHFGGLSTPFGNLAAFDWGGLGIPYIHLQRFELGGTSLGGPAVINERGPEIVNLPSGATVIPAGLSARLAEGAAGGRVTHNHFTFNGPVKADTPESVAWQVRRSLAFAGASEP